MRVRWSSDAVSDLLQLSGYIAESRPTVAGRIALHIAQTVSALDTFPYRGRPGRVSGTRELVLVPLPFVAVYEVTRETVIVLRILHGARRWPPGQGTP